MANRDIEYLLTKKGLERYIVMTTDVGVSRKLYIGAGDEYLKVCRALEILERTKNRAALDLLIDIGTNLGHISIPILKRGLAQRAVGFEPNPDNFRICSANILINNLGDKITLHNTALGAKIGEVLEFELSEDNSGDHRVRVTNADGAYSEASRKMVMVQSTTLDSFFHDPPSPQSSLIWMDVQGYEGLVLAGASNLLKQKTPMGLEFWPYGLARAQSFESLMNGLRSYTHYFDLNSKNPAPLPIDGLRSVYESSKETQFTTDILVFK